MEVLDHRVGEIELVGLLFNILSAELVGNHELRKIADDLGGWCDFDDVPAKLVGIDVASLDLGPLLAKAK